MCLLLNLTLRSVVITLGGAGAIYFGLFWSLVYFAPLTYAEMDLDHNGTVSFSEADYAFSYGERVVLNEGERCIEFFAYKDGLPLKLKCGLGS
jgi:hypothetical protein